MIDCLVRNVAIIVLCHYTMVMQGQNALIKIDSILKEAYKNNAINGNIIIAKNGKIVLEKSYGYADFEKRKLINTNTQFQIASVSKQFTAFGIMVLKKQSKLAYDDLIIKYFPQFPYNNVTIRHLLQHAAGLPDFWKEIRPKLDTTKINGNNEMFAYLIANKLPLRFEPGEKWEYTDIGYDILALLIEKISGKSYEKFMKKNVFKPAGLKNTSALMVTDLNRINVKNLAKGYLQDSLLGNQLAHKVKNFVYYLGNFYGDGSVISTASDLKKWNDVLLKYQLEDSAHFNEAYMPIIKKNGGIYEFRENTSYGFGWVLVKDLNMGNFNYHTGGHPGFITHYYRYVEKNIVLIVCRNVEQKNSFTPYMQLIRAELIHIK